MSHQPTFTFRTRGGACAGQQWIYDGDDPIARFDSGIIEQPEHNLRYFDGNPRPVNLCDLKLAPGGRPLVAGVQLYWVFEHRVLATTELVDVMVDGQETDALEMIVVTQDPGGVATSRRVLTLTYDRDRMTYVYDFACHLDIHSPEVFDRAEESCFEYCDPWYVDTPGPTVHFPGMWAKRFSHLLADLPDGSTWQMPLNHMATGIPSPQALEREGLFVAAFDPGNNPAFQFLGDTADRTRIGVCNWGYDVHLGARYTRDELYAPICTRFRILRCPDEKAKEMLARANPVPEVTYRGFAELPIYERTTSFASGLKLVDPSPGETDPWPWLPEGDGLIWETRYGRSDSFSLKIDKDISGPAEWVYGREGEGAWTEPWRRGTGFLVTGYVKTENVRGRGSCIALRWGIDNYPERHPYHCSTKLVGTNDWTKVRVELPPSPPIDSGCAHIILRQDGSGTTWFDDLHVQPISSTVHIPGPSGPGPE